MAQLRRMIRQLPFTRAACQQLLLALLLGALFGALCGGLALHRGSAPALEPVLLELPRVSLGRLWALCCLSPALLLACRRTGQRVLFWLFFFCRSALVCCLLCFCAAGPGLGVVLSALWPRLLLPLPVQVFTACVWMESPQEGGEALWLLIPLGLVGFMSLLLETLLR